MANKAFTATVIAVFAVIIIYYILVVAVDLSNPHITCELIDFVANNTVNATANVPISAFYGVYNDSSCSLAYPSAQYLASSAGVKIYTNGTEIYPNMSLTGTQYVSYDYEKTATVWGLDFKWLLAVVMIGVGLYIVGKLSGFGKA